MKIRLPDISFLSIAILSACFFAYMRIQSTLVGYEIGELKGKAARLLDKLSEVKMNLAKYSGKETLVILASKVNKELDPFQSMASLPKDDGSLSN